MKDSSLQNWCKLKQKEQKRQIASTFTQYTVHYTIEMAKNLEVTKKRE